MINQADLKARLYYDPSTGVFNRIGGHQSVGRMTTNGYLQISVNGTRYMAHRLAWLYVYGEWPSTQLDHKNQDRLDNRIDNLRLATNKQNGENVRLFKHNKSGYRGVSFDRGAGKWRADIKHNGKNVALGKFDCIRLAAIARVDAEEKLFSHAPDYPRISPCKGKRVVFKGGSSLAPGTTHFTVAWFSATTDSKAPFLGLFAFCTFYRSPAVVPASTGCHGECVSNPSRTVG